MARKEKKSVTGLNEINLEGVITNYWCAKSDKAPDCFSIEVPYGDYGTRVTVKVWSDSEAMKDIEEQEIDEGMRVKVKAKIVCLKSNDYKSQVFADEVTKVSE